MKKAISFVALLLIGDAAAEKLYRKHGHSYVQFLEGDYEDWNTDFSQDKTSQESVSEAEKQMGHAMKVDAESQDQAIKGGSKLHFDQDGETFSKATSISDSTLLAMPTYYNPVPGVTMIMSDPIHGSLGEPKIKMEDLTPEQQFEESQRRKKPVVFKDDKEQVTDTSDSIKWAEENTGGKMPEPVDKEKIKKTPKYHLADSDDEDDETVETRKSVKTAEKQLKHRFFINAKEKKSYEKAIAEGKVNPKQLTFDEDEDEEFGPIDSTKQAREAAKKAAKIHEIHVKKAEKTAKKLTKEEREAKEKEDEIAEAKKDTEENKVPTPKKDGEKEVVKSEPVEKAPTASDLPPELAGNLEAAPAEKKAAFAQQKSRAYESDSESDSDSSDSDSDDE